MKAIHLIALFATLCVAGCVNKQEHFTTPSSVEVQRSVARVGEYVKPEGRPAYQELQKSLNDYQSKVDQQSLLLFKAQNDAEYWHQKQIKALKELWAWRGIALISVALVIGYIGIKTSWRFLL